MKKIMFNDKYGLTDAVIHCRKTMTRRVIKDKELIYSLQESEHFGGCFSENHIRGYRVGEVVGVAQSYKDLGWKGDEIWIDPKSLDGKGVIRHSPGWKNKMFVRAEACTTRIRIKDIRVERLQDISDEDCLREGVFKWGDPFHEDRVEDFGFFGATIHYDTPREAFADLIDKVSGRGTWKRNPWVYVYEFELEKGGDR